MKKIFLLTNEGFTDTFYSICTGKTLYHKSTQKGESDLYTHHNHILVQRKVTYEEALFLLNTVKHNGNGDVCGMQPKEEVELMPTEETKEMLS